MAVDPTLGGLRDGTDFPHSGIFHALNIASEGSYAILDGNNFDITQSDSSGNTQFVVAAGRVFRNGEYLAEIATATFTQGTPATFDEPIGGNMYYLLVVNSTNALEMKNNGSLTAVDIVPVPAAGDIPIAVVRLGANETVTQRHVQFLTTGKNKNSLSVGYDSSGYVEAGSLTGDSNGITMTGLYKLDTLPTATVDSAQSKILIQDGDNTNEIRTVTAGDVGDLGKQDLQGVSNLGATTTTSLTAASFIKTSGTSSQFLKADGSSDSSTYLTVESDTLDSVTGRGTGTTANAIGIGGLTNDGHLLSSTLDAGLAATDLASASKTANIYYISAGVSLGDALNNQIIQIKNIHSASVTINSTSPFDGGVGSLTDQRVTGTTTVVLESNEAITCQFRTDGTNPQGWYILDTDVDTDTDTDTGILNVVEDTTPQLGGDLDVNGNSIVSTSNGDITIAPHGTGVLTVSNNIELTDDKYIKWGTDSYIQSTQSGADLTIHATDDLFLRGTDAIALRNGSNYTMWLTVTNRVGVGTTTPTATLDVADGETFRTPRLLTVDITADDTLTETEHAGRYCFVTGGSRTITLGAGAADIEDGIHYTLISNDANGFTLASTKTMNGSLSDITVDARNAVTIIADGSNYVVLGA